jgi:esterase/lipase superfamily enzyme/uncharacterized protein YjbI with pentapeptide repeats
MASLEALALLDSGREAWNSNQASREKRELRRPGAEVPILDLTRADLDGRNFEGWTFFRVDLSHASLRGANLRGCRLFAVDLTGANAEGGDLSEARLEIVDLSEANLSGSTLAGVSSTFWTSFHGAALIGANLSNAALKRSRFDLADLTDAMLWRSDLAESSFCEASLRDADLSGANLTQADLQGADLRGARLTETNLDLANLYRCLPEDLVLDGALNVPSHKPRRVFGLASGPGGGGGGGFDPPDSESLAELIPVLFVTDRVLGTGRHAFGVRPSESLSFGVCRVSVPKFDRPMGQIPRPNLWKLEFRENLARHVVILKIDTASEGNLGSLLSEYADDERGCVQALLFVHGYNVMFEDAIREVAQLAYDLNFKGVPILYSWASQGKKSAYPADLANNEKTFGRLAQTLCALHQQRSCPTVHVLAHSMGARALCHASRLVPAECPSAGGGFKNVLLASPDVHPTTLREALPEIRATAERITLYFCPDDVPLRLSRAFHSTPRAGEFPFIADGLDTIDASAVATGFLRHSEYEKKSVLADIFELIERGTPPSGRFALEPVQDDSGQYFRIRP